MTDSNIRNKYQVIDQILVTWQYALKSNYAMKPDANFFDVGGTSLQAVEIALDIEKIFGIDLPLSSFIDAATPIKQAELVIAEEWDNKWDTAVAIKPHGSKPPFFCIHPSDGNVLCYFDLASAMGNDYPFYGIQAEGLKGDQKPLQTVTDMAKHYFSAIRNIQPSGPYYIGGWSAGGVIAFEIAQIFSNEGTEVHPVLIDTNFPGIRKKQNDTSSRNTVTKEQGFKDSHKDFATRQTLFGNEQSNIPSNYTPASTLRSLWSKAALNYDLKTYQGSVDLILSRSYDTIKSEIHFNLRRSMADGNAKQSETLIRNMEILEANSPLNWRHVVRGHLTLRSTAGGHHSLLFKENVPALAQNIMRIIDESVSQKASA